MSNNFLVSKGEKIRASRKAKGLSQAELAQRLGMSQRIVSKYEKGDLKGGSAVTLRKIEEALDIEPLFLFMKVATELSVVSRPGYVSTPFAVWW